MANIRITPEVIADILRGRADYVKQKRMYYDSMYIDKNELVLKKGKKKLAVLEFPKTVNFNNGDTVTIMFESSMPIKIDT
jgi:uncharacterized protein YlbG (UPF0298 family)